jgi:DNA-binding LacI/PurR family transcriptional regulator
MSATKEQISRAMLRQILDGELSPGSRLPTRAQLQDSFGAGPMTVQAALDLLRQHGFVVAKRGLGTHVAAHPPHLFQYGLVFPRYPSASQGWARFWTALDKEANSLAGSKSRRIVTFYGVDGHIDGEGYQKLESHVGSHQLAGVIFAVPPYELEGLPLMHDATLPKVSITVASDLTDTLSVRLDTQSFVDKALDYLLARGRKRIAVMTLSEVRGRRKYLDAIELGAAARGMTIQPYWRMRVAGEYPEGASDYAHLLMQPHQTDRPDGMIITDDNLVEFAAAGLIAAGAKIPQDMEIVGHCNFPWPTPSIVPVKRLGFDAREVLSKAIATIDACRSGTENPPTVAIQAVFEDEVSAVRL